MTITDEGVRIEMPLLDLSDRKVSSKKEVFLLLKENTIEYKIVGKYSSNDNDQSMWKDYEANYRWTKEKKSY